VEAHEILKIIGFEGNRAYNKGLRFDAGSRGGLKTLGFKTRI